MAKEKSGKGWPSEDEIRARQQRNLDKAAKMMEEDSTPNTSKKYSADQLGKRLEFITDATQQARFQREADAERADKPKREAANEMKRETRGVAATPEADARSMAQHRFSQGFDKPLFGGKEGLPVPGMKKGGKVSSASKRADGIAIKGKTRGRIV